MHRGAISDTRLPDRAALLELSPCKEDTLLEGRNAADPCDLLSNILNLPVRASYSTTAVGARESHKDGISASPPGSSTNLQDSVVAARFPKPLRTAML